MYIGILLGAYYILHISRISVFYTISMCIFGTPINVNYMDVVICINGEPEREGLLADLDVREWQC